MTRIENASVIRAVRGSELSAKSWLTEAPMRMLMNNLDPEVGEKPNELVVYGGIGRAARDWESFDRIVATLQRLEGDETLLVQSGKPVGVFRTHAEAPRVLIANSNLVPHWANWEHFNMLDRKGLMMFVQMTAGSWIYIGSQGIIQGTYETSGHDPVNGYLPKGWTTSEWETRRETDPKGVASAARKSMAEHVRAMLDFHRMGIPVVDYGNNIRQMALEEGVKDAFDFPGFVPAYIRPLFCRGIGPFRWAALSGDPEDIYRTDAKVKELLPDNAALHHWLDMARERIAFQGLPARICWVGLGDRHRLGLAFNEMVARGELKAPVVIGRDHLDSGSVASPNRETESMRDGSDAVSDWPMLNALLNYASGATWVSLHHGGGVGMGYSQHAGLVIVW